MSETIYDLVESLDDGLIDDDLKHHASNIKNASISSDNIFEDCLSLFDELDNFENRADEMDEHHKFTLSMMIETDKS